MKYTLTLEYDSKDKVLRYTFKEVAIAKRNINTKKILESELDKIVDKFINNVRIIRHVSK